MGLVVAHADDPLLEPIDGVDMEEYARLSAELLNGASATRDESLRH